MNSGSQLGNLRRFALFASFFSAFSALVYQSLWLRSFGLAFGGTTASISLVLAVFMAGLALGSAWARRLASQSPLKTYALAEAGMGLSAIAAQFLLGSLPGALSALSAPWNLSPANDVVVKALLAAVVVLPCAVCSGLTLPLLMDALDRGGENEHRGFGRLYAWNTFGAALGALAAVFFLIPAFGVLGAAVAAAFFNLSLAVVAASLAKRLALPAPAIKNPETQEKGRSQSALLRFGLAAAASGAIALVLEVLWTRSLALLLGSSVYAFALMLAATLLGIALGGALYARRQENLKRPLETLALGYALLALAILASAYAMGWIPDLFFAYMRHVRPSFALYQGFGFVLALLCLAPVAALSGFLFPLLLRLSRGEGGRRDSGALYVYNTLGCIAGALLAGLWMIPKAGLQANYSLAAGAAAMLAAYLWPKPKLWRLGAAVLALALGVLGALTLRPWNALVVSSGVFHSGIILAPQTPAGVSFRDTLLKKLSLEYYREGAEAVVAVRRDPEENDLSLVVNGKVDASIQGDVITQTLLAQLPLCLKPDAQELLVIGWGSGCTVGSAAAHPLTRIDCVEIEPAVARTASLFQKINSHKWAPLDPSFPPIWMDPRLTLRYADARQDLLRRDKRYDVIISEPSNPWISGVSNLFTLDFYQLARRRLNKGGLFCQWFHLYSMSQEDMRRQLRTFAAVFPKTSLWIAPEKPGNRGVTGDIILLGSEAEPDLESEAVIKRIEDPLVAGDLMRADCCGAIEDPAKPLKRDRWWLYSLRLLGDADLRRYAGAGDLNSDDRPLLEFSAPRSLYRDQQASAIANMELLRAMEMASQDLVPPLRSLPLAQVMVRLGEHYSQRNLFRKAIAALTKAEEAGVKDPNLDLNLGYAYFFTGQGDQAKARFQKAFPALPTAYTAFLKQGGTYLKSHRPDMALRFFEMALRIRPTDAEAHFGRGVSLAQSGRRPEALAEMRETLRLNPNLEPAQRALRDLAAMGQGQ
ncbi:MAG: tetratricopeptide repeat protein [candidate division FCPU426 bacterium]